VHIEPREVGGRLVISFFSAGDLQELLNSMRVQEEGTTIGTVFDGVPEQPVVTRTHRTQQYDDAAQSDEVRSVEAALRMADVEPAPDTAALGDVQEQVLASEGHETPFADGTETETPAPVAADPVAVVPDPVRPMPEPTPTPTEQQAVSEESLPQASSPEEPGLYSIRNFSI
jgi:hypothetical protein